MKKLGDAAVAATVVVCSVVLLVSLAFALNGNPFSQPSRTLRAHFTDVTGVQQSSIVKYGGATAGTVHSIRMLTPEERTATGNPANAIELVLALNRNVPDLNEGLVASLASDTLLSDKFILIEGGDPTAPVLANAAIVPSITPVTFDAILRDLNATLGGMNALIGSAQDGGGTTRIRTLMEDLTATVTEARALIGGANTMIQEGGGLVKNGNQLIDETDLLIADGRTILGETRDPLKSLLAQLSSAADSLDDMAKRADALVKNNEDDLSATVADARKAVADLKIAAANTRELIDSLRARPQQIIWGPGRQRRSE